MTTSMYTELRDRITVHLSDPDTDHSTAHLACMLGEGGAYGHQLVRLLLARHAERRAYGEGLWAHATSDPVGVEPVNGYSALRYARILTCAAQEGFVTAASATRAIETNANSGGGKFLTSMGDQGYLTRHRLAPNGVPSPGPRVGWSLRNATDTALSGPLAMPCASEPLSGQLKEEVMAWVACIGATSLPQVPSLVSKRGRNKDPLSQVLRERVHAHLAQRPEGTTTPQVFDHFRRDGANLKYHLEALENEGRVLRVKTGRVHFWYALASVTGGPEESRPTAREGAALARPPRPEAQTVAASALDRNWRPVGTCGCHFAPARAPLPGNERAHRFRDQAADSLTTLFGALREEGTVPEDVRTLAAIAAEDLLPVMRSHLAAGLEEWAARLEFARPDTFATDADHRLNLYRVSVLREVIDWLATTGNDDTANT